MAWLDLVITTVVALGAAVFILWLVTSAPRRGAPHKKKGCGVPFSDEIPVIGHCTLIITKYDVPLYPLEIEVYVDRHPYKVVCAAKNQMLFATANDEETCFEQLNDAWRVLNDFVTETPEQFMA